MIFQLDSSVFDSSTGLQVTPFAGCLRLCGWNLLLIGFHLIGEENLGLAVLLRRHRTAACQLFQDLLDHRCGDAHRESETACPGKGGEGGGVWALEIRGEKYVLLETPHLICAEAWA